MAVDVNRMAQVGVEQPRIQVEQPRASRPSPVRRILMSVAKRVWSALVVLISGPGLGASGGIDDEAMPSGFMAPYRRGSRQVRNLWHLPF
jgi:hypothetical protein